MKCKVTGRIVLSNEKRYLRKYSVVFFKAFSKKEVFGGPCIKFIRIMGTFAFFFIELKIIFHHMLLTYVL